MSGSLLEALWNDPNAQTRVDLTVSGLTWVDMTGNPLAGSSLAVWTISGTPDLVVGDANEFS